MKNDSETGVGAYRLAVAFLLVSLGTIVFLVSYWTFAAGSLAQASVVSVGSLAVVIGSYVLSETLGRTLTRRRASSIIYSRGWESIWVPIPRELASGLERQWIMRSSGDEVQVLITGVAKATSLLQYLSSRDADLGHSVRPLVEILIRRTESMGHLGRSNLAVTRSRSMQAGDSTPEMQVGGSSNSPSREHGITKRSEW
jgi:hypothetical protein